MSVLLWVVVSVVTIDALNNGAAITPPMGWSTWNKLKCRFNATTLLEVADSMVNSGMVSAGYTRLNIDDCWPLKKRDQNGSIIPDPKRFPDGMMAFSAALRSRGLTLGIYTSHGNFTCQKFPGSYGFEKLDAATYASWGVTYVKNDWCSNRQGYPAVPDLASFNAMRDALNATGKKMVYSIHWNYGNTKGPTCDKGVSCPLPETANMWRIGGDIGPNWGKILGLIDIDTPLFPNATVGAWNDADMMEVGNGMSKDQDQAHFTMWCMLSSPLISGNDPRKMSAETIAILTNKFAIAINQDALGHQARLVSSKGTQGHNTESKKVAADQQVWIKALANPKNSWAVALLNRIKTPSQIVLNFTSLGVAPTAKFDVLDLWDRARSIGVHTGSIKATVNSTAAVMYKLIPQ